MPSRWRGACYTEQLFPRRAIARQVTALGRYGDPADIAAMVAFLASAAGRFATGGIFTVDGGANA